MRHDGLRDHCLELLAAVGQPRARRMFGGHGLYVDDLFVAILAGDRLYLKADGETVARFQAAGCEPFVYSAQGKTVSVGYWSAPEEALDSPAGMAPWARLAMAAALRARGTARPRLSATRKAGRRAPPKPASGATAPPASPATSGRRRKP